MQGISGALERVLLSRPYRACWSVLRWLRRPHVYCGDRVILTRTLFGHWMYLDASELNVAPSLIIRGYWEMDVTRVLLAELRPGMRYVEVGANCGYYTLLALSRIGKDGQAFAFEANPRMADLARRSLQVNGFRASDVRSCAVSDHSGRATLFLGAHQPGGGNLYTHDHPHNQAYDLEKPKTIEVPVVTLDEVFANDPAPIDVLRIDAEGSEAAILAGAAEVLARSPNIKIILEYFPAMLRKSGYDPAEFLRSLVRSKYRVRRIGPRGLMPLPAAEMAAGIEIAMDLLVDRDHP